MELWIKVQNNKKLKQGLVKVDDLFVEKDEEDKWIIRQCCDTLGIYKTEKRALEVLDEIQEILEQVNDPNLTILPILVYEMPKE